MSLSTDELAPPAPAAREEANDEEPRADESRRGRRRLIGAVAAVVAIAVIAVVATRGGDGADATSVASTTQVADVTRGSMNETVSADGTVAAASTDDLSFTASGTVSAVNVKAGDEVTAGQVLATLDAPEVMSALAAAESNVADAEAALEDDQSSGASDAQLAADEASLTTARDALTEAQKDVFGVSLVAEFDGTVTSVGISVDEHLASGGVGGTDTSGSQSGSGQSSGANGSSSGGAGGLPDTGSDTGSGDDSTTTTPHIQVVSTNRYSVELDVDSASVDAIEAGQEVTLTVTTGSSSGGFPAGFPDGFPGGGALPGSGNGGGTDGGDGAGDGGGAPATPGGTSSAATATGKVTEVGAVANADSGVARYPVTVTFTAGSDEFAVGATVSADIVTAARDDVLQVQLRAVTTEDGVSQVTVATDGTADGPTESRTVETGLTANGMVEITQGLKAGEKVVIEAPTGFPGGGGTDGGPAGGTFPGGGAGG